MEGDSRVDVPSVDEIKLLEIDISDKKRELIFKRLERCFDCYANGMPVGEIISDNRVEGLEGFFRDMYEATHEKNTPSE